MTTDIIKNQTESTEVTEIINNKNHDNDNRINDNIITKKNEQITTPQSLDTPSRLSTDENTKHTETNGIGGDMTTTSLDPLKEEEVKKPLISNVTSEINPLTINREKKMKEGISLVVRFDEKVVVHTVPYWDPCGETYYDYEDEETGARGPNCCIIL